MSPRVGELFVVIVGFPRKGPTIKAVAIYGPYWMVIVLDGADVAFTPEYWVLTEAVKATR